MYPLIDRIIGDVLQADGEDCPPTGWDRLEVGDLPPSPFKLQPCVTITDAGMFLESIRREVDLGPSSARARLGTLQDDLRFLALRIRGDVMTEEVVEVLDAGV